MKLIIVTPSYLMEHRAWVDQSCVFVCRIAATVSDCLYMYGYSVGANNMAQRYENAEQIIHYFFSLLP